MTHKSMLESCLGVALFILACCLLLSAQSADLPAPLSLVDALDIADRQNLNLQIIREELKIAEGRITEARAGALPYINVGAQYARVDDVPTLSLGDVPMQMGQLNNYKASVEARQVLYAGGGVRAALRMAKEYRTATDHGVQFNRAETAYGIHALFNRVLLAREDVKVAQEAIELSEQNVSDVRSQFEQGLAKRFDLLRAEEQRTQSYADKIAADNGLNKSRLALFRALEVSLDDPREIVGELRFEPVVFDKTNALTIAMTHRDDLAEANRNIQIQREAIKVVRSAGRPQVGLFGEVRESNPNRVYQDEWEDSWTAGIRADFPIFDGLKTRGQVAQQTAKLRQTELQRDNLISEIGLDVSDALADLGTAEELVKARRQRVEEAEEAMRLARRGYEEGVQPQIDVLEAQHALSSSRRGYAQALFEHTMSRRRLERAIGILLAYTPSLEQN